MPRALPWSDDRDAELLALIAGGATLRQAETKLGVSRSFCQRRMAVLGTAAQVKICAPEREAAGVWPLPAGHPISAGAIALSF